MNGRKIFYQSVFKVVFILCVLVEANEVQSK